jgi:Na+/melibiose symporter-like transporter
MNFLSDDPKPKPSRKTIYGGLHKMSTAAQSNSRAKIMPWMFFLAYFFQIVGGTIAGSYLNFYLTDRVHLAVATIGVVLLATRIVDLLIGVVAGIIIQKTQLKWGQYRSWLLLGPIAVAIGTTMCISNAPVPDVVKYVIIFVGYILYGGGMSFIQTSQNGIMSKIAGPDISLRMAISSKMVQGQSAGTLVASIVTLPLVGIIDGRGGDGYFIIQLVFAVLGCLGQMVLFTSTSSYESYEPRTKADASGGKSMGTMYKETLSNPQLILVLVADAIRWTAMMGLMMLGSYYFTYVMGDINKLTIALTASSIFTVIASFIAPPIAAKLGKKNSALISSVCAGAAYLCLGLFAKDNLVLYITFSTIALAGSSLINSVGVNLYLDCAEYQQFKTGKENKAVTMSMFGVSIKLGLSASSILISTILLMAGYDGVNNTVSDPRQLGLLIGVVPAILMAAYGVLMLMYRITEDKAKEYAEHNFKQTTGA